MKIKEGDKLPPAEFYYLDTDSAVQKIESNSLFKDQKSNYVWSSWCFY